MIPKKDWNTTISSSNFDNFYELFIQLNSIKRFKFHDCSDSVLNHTSRMLNIHTSLLKQQKNDFLYFAILFHDFEELFIGDIPTINKSTKSEKDEKQVLLLTFKQVLSLNEEDFNILKLNINKLLKIDESTKKHIKITDTFDAMMFSLHNIINNNISFLGPFFYYIDSSKEKSFTNYLKKANLEKNSMHSFFNYQKFMKNINGYNYYVSIFNAITTHSFTSYDIEKILKFESERIINTQNQTIPFHELNIENFQIKLEVLKNILKQNPHYKKWLSIYKNSSFSKKDFETSMKILKNRKLE